VRTPSGPIWKRSPVAPWTRLCSILLQLSRRARVNDANIVKLSSNECATLSNERTNNERQAQDTSERSWWNVLQTAANRMRGTNPTCSKTATLR